VITEKTTTAEK
jgi:hypothetical protein